MANRERLPRDKRETKQKKFDENYVEIHKNLSDDASSLAIMASLSKIGFENRGFYLRRDNDGIGDYFVFLDDGTYAASVPHKDVNEFESLILGLYQIQNACNNGADRNIGVSIPKGKNEAPDIMSKSGIDRRLNELCGNPLDILQQAASGRGFTLFSPRRYDAKLVKQYLS